MSLIHMNIKLKQLLSHHVPKMVIDTRFDNL
jgi:hypothetical protein